MNNANNYYCNSKVNTLESLRYDSLFSNLKFEIDSKNNLHITKLSMLKDRNEIVPLDLINPQPISKKRLNPALMLLALTSILISGTFFAAAIIMGQLWTVAFAMVLGAFGIGTLIASYKNRTKIYQYNLANTETLLFSLSDPTSQNQQVELFVNALNQRIINFNEKTNKNVIRGKIEPNEETITPLDINDEMEIYIHGKQSQYMKHLDFLFNHGIVDEILYSKLENKINKRISDSENRFMTDKPDYIDDQTAPNNIINFPVNA